MKYIAIKDLLDKSSLKELIKKNQILKRTLHPISVARKMFFRKKREAQYEIINNLKDILAGDPLIKVDEFQGIFLLDCRSDLFKRLVLYKCYEPELVQCCKDLIDKNRDTIDIGANVGFFTVLFAKTLNNRKVLSIEPTNLALSRLYKNILLNQVQEKVIVFEGAASNSIGEVQIKTIEGKEEFSSLGAMMHPSIATEKNYSLEKVKASTIDDLIQRYSIDPGFIKIDVEGVEHLVFAGAKNTLLNNKPIILSELSDYLLRENGSSAKDVVNFIKECGYDVINPLSPNVPLVFEEVKNILCLPKLRRMQLWR